jgi:hypothetical protein
MQDKMIKKSATLILIFLLILFKAQSKKINILIMIDEKPSLITENLQLSSKSLEPIKANYIVGTVDLTEENYTKLFNDKAADFNLSFNTILPKRTFASNYSIIIPKNFLKQEYIIINIFNMDNKIYKRKYSKLIKNIKEYYVVIETPNSMKFD